jgi:glycosyltransferase involved in cell wall biosynthesis
MERRIEADAVNGWKASVEPRRSISVCMATYNGERYVEMQLQSILRQLAESDEIIVVDDASTDRTREKIFSLHDSRIRLIEHYENRGVLCSFEDAIRSASGKVIFLSDQDDIWLPDKVSTILRMFQLHPKIDLVASDASLIDEDGAIIGASYYEQRGSFRSGVVRNICRCSYLGCTMAFRSRIREKVLPFPLGRDVLHDLWIGIINSFIGGQTLYLDRPLVCYRRHEHNATGNSRLSVMRRFRIRWDACLSLAEYWVRR